MNCTMLSSGVEITAGAGSEPFVVQEEDNPHVIRQRENKEMELICWDQREGIPGSVFLFVGHKKRNNSSYN